VESFQAQMKDRLCDIETDETDEKCSVAYKIEKLMEK